MVGCATSPDYDIGWIDSYLGVSFDGETYIIDAECLIDSDYERLGEYCPECVTDVSEPQQEPTNILEISDDRN